MNLRRRASGDETEPTSRPRRRLHDGPANAGMNQRGLQRRPPKNEDPAHRGDEPILADRGSIATRDSPARGDEPEWARSQSQRKSGPAQRGDAPRIEELLGTKQPADPAKVGKNRRGPEAGRERTA